MIKARPLSAKRVHTRPAVLSAPKHSHPVQRVAKVRDKSSLEISNQKHPNISTETVGCSSTTDTFTCQLQTITNIWTSTASDEALPSLGGGGILGYTYLPAATTVIIPSSTLSSIPVTTIVITQTVAPTVVPSTVTITTTTTEPPTTTTQIVIVSPTLKASCDYW